VEDVALASGELGALPEGPGWAGEGSHVDPVELAADLRPGVLASVLGDAGQEQRQPAQDDVGADALFLAVVDGAQVDDLLEVALAAFDLQELLVAQAMSSALIFGSDVLSRYFPVEVLLGLRLPRVNAEKAAGG
jgi:hypothetical protein